MCVHVCVLIADKYALADLESLTCVSLKTEKVFKTQDMKNCISYQVLPDLSPGHITGWQNHASHMSMGCRGCLHQRSPGQVKSVLHAVASTWDIGQDKG